MLDRQITVDKSNHIKAIALLLMMMHHLFGCGEFLTLPENEWFSFLPELVKAFSSSAKICIAIFLFCSGYGLYKSYVEKPNTKRTYILSRLIKVLIPYWVIMALTIVYLLASGKFEPKYIFVNLFALLHNDEILYVSFSWFIKLYLCVILSMPFVKSIEKRWKRKKIYGDILIYIIIPIIATYVLSSYQNETNFKTIPSFVLSTLHFFFSFFPLVSVGMLFAKYGVYEKLSRIVDNVPTIAIIIVSILICFLVLLLRYFFVYGYLTDLLYAPTFIISFLFLLDNLKHKSRVVIPFIGKKSIQYWLLSGLFFLNTSELQFIVYLPKYTIAILVWTMIILTPLVIICDFISSRLVGFICKRM